MRTLMIALTSAFLVSGGAAAQRVEFDSALGKYRIHYHSEYLGRLVTVIVEPPNKIDPALRLITVENVGDELVYAYVIANSRGPSNAQAIDQLDFDCPVRARMSTRIPQHWSLLVGSSWSAPRHTCRLVARSAVDDAAVEPGQSLTGTEIQTSMLPAVGLGRFWGDAEYPEWPDGESGEVFDPSVADAVNRVKGITGGWVERMVVAPVRDAEGLSALEILDALDDDVVTVCEARRWISQPLCRSFQEQLERLLSALNEGRSTEARKRAAELLGDVQDSWEAPERQLEPDAYWLLRMNLEAVTAGLDDVLSTENLEAPSDTTSNEARGFWGRLWSAFRRLGR